MPVAQVNGVVVSGVTGQPVKVEVDLSSGLPSVGVIGLPDPSVNESRWRARSAIASVGIPFPPGRVTISLSPAELRKAGAGLDLPITIGILLADGRLRGVDVSRTAFIGELGLNGELRPARGVLACALAARAAGIERIVVARRGSREVAQLPGLTCIVAERLSTVLEVLKGEGIGDQPEPDPSDHGEPAGDIADLRDVRGHAHARFALEVAAAGGHHLVMVGPPGVGKTLLAERLPGLLPPLTDEAAIEVAAIHSVAGYARSPRDRDRPPFQAPHHTASSPALLGAVHGSRVAPGAATLAHRGVLFMDEAPEFPRPVLEGLRQPLESGVVALGRSGWSGLLPARFQLAMAANPCPCGQRAGSGALCSCTPNAIRRYAARLSGPLMDRVDIRLSLSRPAAAELRSSDVGEDSASVRERVVAARARARARFEGLPWDCNAQVPTGVLRRSGQPGSGGAELLHSLESGSTSLRGVDRVLRIAWTLADLAGKDRPDRDEIAAAMGLRGQTTAWAA